MKLLAGFDWAVIVVYFIAVFAVAIYVTRKDATRTTAEGYFLGGRNAGWFVIGASLFASNIGSEHLVGLAGTGAASGVAVGQFEVLASLILLLLGWVFVPFYLRSGVYTMPEFLERRYSATARWYLAVISIVGYVLTKISVTIAAGGIVFEALMGINFWWGALVVVGITGVYTLFGGLRAVLYTDLLQMFVLIGGAIAVTVIGLNALGGWSVMAQTAGPEFMSLWKPMSDPDFPWTGILLGAPILGVWYWCTDQFIVQRVLSAANIDQARRGTIFGASLKVLPLFIFVIPGVIAYSLSQKGMIELATPDQALPTLIGTLLPVGIKGLVVAGLLAALMSSLSSVFNSCSTLITMDIYKKLRPEASEKHLVVIGQLSVVALVAFGLAWIPVMQSISGQIYQYLQSVQAYISPPIAAVFLIGVFWKRVNSAGAVASLATGFVLGIGRLGMEIWRSGMDAPAPFWFADMNFLHFAIFLFVVCVCVLVLVSFTRPEADAAQLAGITMQTAGDGEAQASTISDATSRRLDVWLSVVVVLAVAAVWGYFTG